MGLVRAEIQLINAEELGLVRRNLIDQIDVKNVWVTALVDSGAYMLCINENIRELLNLPFVEKRFGYMADGTKVECDAVGPIIVKFKNRTATCNAMVLPGDSEVLLGAIPLEEMDVLIHPQRQELIVNPEHPYFAQLSLKGVR